MITLLQATQQLGPYLRNDEDAVAKINLAIERILAFGKWRGLTQTLELKVYEDGQITLPQDFETALAFARESRALQPRDPWFRFYQGSLRADPSIYAADMGDEFPLFRPITGCTHLRFNIAPRGGAGTKGFVLAVVQSSGAPEVGGEKLYLTDTLHGGREVYSNAGGTWFLWGDSGDEHVYLSPAAGDTSGPYWRTATGPFTEMLFMDFLPMNGAAGDPIRVDMLVPAERLPLGSSSYDDTGVKFSMTVSKSTDQGIAGGAAQEIISGTIGDYVEPFGADLGILDVVRFSKERSEGIITLEARFPNDHPTYQGWHPVGIFSERDTEVKLRRYTLPGVPAGDTVIALCKKRYRAAADPSDELPIDSIYVLRLALEAVSYEDAGDLDKAANYWGLCRKALDDTLSEHRNASGRTLPIYVRAAAGSGLRALR